MPAAQKSQQGQPNSGGTNYANPKAQKAVHGANESSINEVDSDLSEEDEYDNDKDDSLNPFTQPPRMPPYDFAKRKLSQLIELMNGPYLDLAPHYQRDVVWTRKAMRLLIDSMRNGYYIPPVIFNVTEMTDQYGTMRFKRTCVDGKQRLTSIRDFLNGKFPCKIDKKLWYFRDDREKDENGTPLKGNQKKVLPDTARENFMKIEVLCTEYKGLSQTQEIELFQRVQLGKPLTQSEAFRATQGSWQEFAKLYEKDFADVVHLVKQKRASGFRGILTCFSQIYECLDPSQENGVPRLRNSMKSLELLCSNSQSLDTMTKSHLRSVFETFQELVDMDRTIFENNGYTRTKTFSPIELVGVCCLLSQKMERPIGWLRGDILAMRAQLREIHSDLRVNRQCWASVWNFIEGLERQRGAVDGSTVEKSTWKTVGRPRQPRTTQIRATSSSHRSSSLTNPRTSDGVLQDSSRHANTNPLRSSTSRWGMVDRTGQSARINPLVGHPDATYSEGTTPREFEQATEDIFRVHVQHRETGRELVADRRSQLEAGSEGPFHRPLTTSNASVDDVERATSRDNTASVPRMTLESSPVTPTFGDNAAFGSAMAPPASRKRVALDLGANSNDVLALEAKRARLRAGVNKFPKALHDRQLFKRVEQLRSGSKTSPYSYWFQFLRDKFSTSRGRPKTPNPTLHTPERSILTQNFLSILRNHGSSKASKDAAVSANCGKGTPRRKMKKVHKTSGTDDKKLQTSLKKLNVQPIQAIEEVNMFKEDGNVIHFAAPKVHASVPSNTFAIYGAGEDKELTELVPGILNQLGPDSLASLRKLAESYQSLQKKEGGGDGGKGEEEDDDDIPDLVEGENFESKVE